MALAPDWRTASGRSDTYVPASPETMSARRLQAKAAALHLETQRREIAAATAKKEASRYTVDAETWKVCRRSSFPTR